MSDDWEMPLEEDLGPGVPRRPVVPPRIGGIEQGFPSLLLDLLEEEHKEDPSRERCLVAL